MAEQKTNVMRFLDQKKIAYIPHEYSFSKDEVPDGVSVAAMIGKNQEEVYKTLVTKGASKKILFLLFPLQNSLI